MAVFNKEFKLDQLQNEFYNRMNEFRKQNLYCDVILDLDGKHFPCHRLILTAVSKYFQAMFSGNFKESTSQTVVLKEIEPEIMEQILDTIYTARIHLTPQKVYSVLKTSHLLQLESIVDACGDCIKSYPQVYYLIEIYFFAKEMSLHKLYDICVQALADDLIHWGRTDAFMDLEFEDLNLILSKGYYPDVKDEVFLLIAKWSKCNNADATGVHALLQSAKLGDKMIGSAAVAQYVVSGESDFVNAFNTNPKDDEIQINVDYCINLYMKTSEVKTGDKGWSVLKMSDSLHEYTLSNFYSSDSIAQKVCKIGTKLYCFEWNNVAKKCLFSYYEDNKRTELNVPSVCVVDNSTSSHEKISLVSFKSSIYLTGNGSSRILRYNCELDEWIESFRQRDGNENAVGKAALYNCPLGSFGYLTASDDVLYFILMDSIIGFDSRTPTRRNYITLPQRHCDSAICSFDGKIALSGSNHYDSLHNTFSIFDIRANRFQTDLKPMNFSRAKHKLIHRGNFLYAIENRPFATNEKYDITSNEWINVPSLPKRVLLKRSDGTTTFATGYVFDADVVPITVE